MPIRWILAGALALAATGPLLAQDVDVRVTKGPDGPEGDVFFTMAVPPPGMPGGPAGEGPGDLQVDEDMVVLFAHDGAEARVVKGAPYQAEAVTEITQRLADGNKIVRKTTSSVARDGEGRTRREGSLAAVGPFPAGDNPPRHVFIQDPVAGVSYALEPEEKIARKLTKPGELPKPGELHGGPPLPGPRTFERRMVKRFPKGDTESLGTQTIEGVDAEGTRRRFTIPAGEIGNEKPIEVVSERWYSKELQTVVMSHHSDPRFGETSYRLTRLARGEPDHALFEVPADYAVKEGPPGPHIRHRIIEEKP